jgi:hypothetical protein
MALYCHCNEAITVAQYRITLLMPTIILGFIPVVTGYLIPDFFVLLFGCILISGGLGDFICEGMLRHFDKNMLVIDHPSKAGFLYKDE